MGRRMQTLMMGAMLSLTTAAVAPLEGCAGLTNEEQREVLRLAGHIALDVDALTQGGVTNQEIDALLDHIDELAPLLIRDPEKQAKFREVATTIRAGLTLAIGYENYRSTDPEGNKLRALARALLDAGL